MVNRIVLVLKSKQIQRQSFFRCAGYQSVFQGRYCCIFVHNQFLMIKGKLDFLNLIQFGSLAALLILFACERPPEYSNSPQIEFKSVRYIDYTGPRKDTILIEITFKDGDGDLGLSGTDTAAPFNFRIIGANRGPAGDTLEILTNLNHYNFFCDFFIKRGATFQRVLDFNQDDGIPYQVPVNPFYYRFPVLNPDFKKGPLEGSLAIAIENAFFQRFNDIGTFEPTDSLKLSIYIKDRSLNNSNIVESGIFTIPPYR